MHLTWFLDGRANVAMQLTVSQTGRVHNLRSVYNWAEQASDAWYLSKGELAQLQSDLPLPLSIYANPPKDKITIVSFRRGTQWQIYFYNKSKLPASLLKLMEGQPGKYIIHSPSAKRL